MEGSGSIDFAASYRGWVVIKKASVHEDTKPEEIAFQLASIRQTIDRKAFEILGVDTKALDDYALSVTKEGRKNYQSLANAIQALGSSEAKAAAGKAAGKAENEEPAKVYLLRRIVQNLGFDLDVNQEMLAKVYPNLKLPKPRGRKPSK